MVKSEKELKWLKYRWEFMRRNREYRKDYQAVMAIRKDYIGENDNYIISSDGKQEKQYCEKWGLISSRMFDPKYSFEELLERGPNPEKGKRLPPELKRYQIIINEWYVISALQSDSVKFVYEKSRDNEKNVLVDALINPKPDEFFIHIDFVKINSIENLISFVSKRLRDQYKFPGSDIIGFKEHKKHSFGQNVVELISRERPKRKRLNSARFDRYLIVGDLREQGMSFPQIAKEIFPEAFDDKNEPIGYYDPENARKKTEALNKRYKELVSHGYKELHYP